MDCVLPQTLIFFEWRNTDEWGNETNPAAFLIASLLLSGALSSPSSADQPKLCSGIESGFIHGV
jgi:hypothetical protein